MYTIAWISSKHPMPSEQLNDQLALDYKVSAVDL